MSDDVRVVVAEGPSTRKGLLRFVLEGEGYDVVAEAVTPAELARAVTLYRPDVVVMDDGIGAMAVAMIREIVPAARVILVWPGAVVPIGGDARVEPSEVLRELGPTVERLTGQKSATSLGEMFLTPDGMEQVRNDPATLREILARGEAARLARPGDEREPAASDEAIIEDREPTPIVILPVTSSLDDEDADVAARAPDGEDRLILVPDAGPAEETVVAASAAASVAAGASAGDVARDAERTDLNRRLGTIALGSAAVAGALVLALALGGSRVPVVGIRGEAPGSGTAPVTVGPGQIGSTQLLADGTTGIWLGDGIRPFDGGSVPTPGEPTGTGGGDTGGGNTGGDGGNDGGGGTGGGGVHTAMPGSSATHNPHGGPPGQTGESPGQGNGNGGGHGGGGHGGGGGGHGGGGGGHGGGSGGDHGGSGGHTRHAFTG